MARYVVHVRTARPPEEAFAYLADLTNFAVWDPGVIEAEQAVGDGPGPGAAYDVTVKGVPRPLVLRYHLISYEAPRELVARASTTSLTSLDRISVEPTVDGSIVTYDAELTLNGPLGLLDPLLKLAFNRIGDRAAHGLIDVLDGDRVEEATS